MPAFRGVNFIKFAAARAGLAPALPGRRKDALSGGLSAGRGGARRNPAIEPRPSEDGCAPALPPPLFITLCVDEVASAILPIWRYRQGRYMRYTYEEARFKGGAAMTVYKSRMQK
jgi:hypothetical protein